MLKVRCHAKRGRRGREWVGWEENEIVAKDFGNMFAFFHTKTYTTTREAACDGKLTAFKDWLGYVKGMLYPEVWA